MPEKTLNEIPRDVRELYQKGATALQRQNFDYALAILQQVLQKEPAFFDCRQALRAAQFKKAGNCKFAAGDFSQAAYPRAFIFRVS